MANKWESYPSRVDNQSASIFVNLSYRHCAPIVDATDLVWLRVHLLCPRDDGLPSQEEHPTLYLIEDALVDHLTDAHVEAHYIGRNTSGGCRDFYFYTGDGQIVEDLLSQAMHRLAIQAFDTGHRHDPDWSAYLRFLFPSPHEMQLIKNRHVIEALRQSNDRLNIPRDVLHWAYFTERSGRDAYVAASESLGFDLQHTIDPDTDSKPWGAVLSREHPVDDGSIAAVTLSLHDLATRVGGHYDGWETPVVRDAREG